MKGGSDLCCTIPYRTIEWWDMSCLCSRRSSAVVAVVVCAAVHRDDAQLRTHCNRAITDAYTIRGEGALGRILLPGRVLLCLFATRHQRGGTVASGLCFGLGPPLSLVSSSLASHRLIMRRLPIARRTLGSIPPFYTATGRARPSYAVQYYCTVPTVM
ncbi:hypothetical protein F5B21DRAFT_298386 [Xylaria acuta]|nr:hypothetical protein F5B21DRAFT_298386 [Xylaria acuta]